VIQNTICYGEIETSAAPFFREERRRRRRVRTGYQVRLRPYHGSGHLFEEILPAGNVSRDGIYFITPQPDYHPGMHVYVAYPYSKLGADSEGEVARGFASNLTIGHGASR
jgi:hypothetical protein